VDLSVNGCGCTFGRIERQCGVPLRILFVLFGELTDQARVVLLSVLSLVKFLW
jgi:hypothetical protein